MIFRRNAWPRLKQTLCYGWTFVITLTLVGIMLLLLLISRDNVAVATLSRGPDLGSVTQTQEPKKCFCAHGGISTVSSGRHLLQEDVSTFEWR